MRRLRKATAGLVVIVASACGGDGGSGGHEQRSGVSGSKRISALSSGEIDDLCRWASEQFRGRQSPPETYCALAALDLAESEDECNAQVAACVERGVEEGWYCVERGDEGVCVGSTSVPINCGATPLADCHATVAEFEACHLDQLEIIDDFFATGSCSNTDAAHFDFASAIEASQACASLSDSCLAIL